MIRLFFTGVEVVVVGRWGVGRPVEAGERGGVGRVNGLGGRGAVRQDQGPRGRVLRQGVGQMRGRRGQIVPQR